MHGVILLQDVTPCDKCQYTISILAAQVESRVWPCFLYPFLNLKFICPLEAIYSCRINFFEGPLTVVMGITVYPLPIILIKNKVDQMLPSSYISSLLVSIL